MSLPFCASQWVSVRGTPLCHTFRSRTLPLLHMRPPPSDASSVLRLVIRAASHHGPVFHLPSHSTPWLLGLPLPSRNIPQCLAQSAQHPPWHPPHRYVFRCTATHSGHTASLPPLCRIFWLHPSCTTASPTALLCLPAAPLSQPAARCHVMSHLRPATASDPPSRSTHFPLVLRWCAIRRCTSSVSSDLGLIAGHSKGL